MLSLDSFQNGFEKVFHRVFHSPVENSVNLKRYFKFIFINYLQLQESSETGGD